MRGRFTSALVLIGLFFSVIVAPTIAHANGHTSVHAGEMLDVHGIDEADHDGSQDTDKEMPCHAVSHHHCSIALQLDAPRVDPKALTADSMTRPAATSPLLSRSQAPPLDPPIA
jgi:hypothetical protein